LGGIKIQKTLIPTIPYQTPPKISSFINWGYGEGISPDLLFKASKYGIYQNTVKNLLMCSKYIKYSTCPDCSLPFKTVYKCHNRYCSNFYDINYKMATAFHRLNDIKLKTHRYYHITIGSNELTKKELEKEIQKFIRKLRKKGYKAYYIKVFDIGKRNHDTTGKYFNHYHIAFLPEIIEVRKFIFDCRQAIKKSKAVFNNIGWRSRNSIFWYFARRVAGQYGHKKAGYYYLDEILGLEKYLETFHRAKVLTYSLPKGLVYNTVLSSPVLECPYCKVPLVFRGYLPITPDFWHDDLRQPKHKPKTPPKQVDPDSFNSIRCKECGVYHYEDDMKNGVCRFCND